MGYEEEEDRRKAALFADFKQQVMSGIQDLMKEMDALDEKKVARVRLGISSGMDAALHDFAKELFAKMIREDAQVQATLERHIRLGVQELIREEEPGR